MTTPLKLTDTVIEGWLRDMGSTPKRITGDPQMVWQFEFDFPYGGEHRLHIASQKIRPRAAIVMSQVAIGPDLHAAFGDLDQDEKEAFLKDLTRILNREYVEFALLGMVGFPTCPAAFQVTSTRFDDGLSLDSLARSASSVYKAELAGISCLGDHLKP